MSLVGELEHLFEQVRPRLDAVFDRWQRLEPALEKFASADELIAYCRTQDRTLYAEKNEALAALCRLATPTAYPGGSDAEAGVLLIYLFSGAFRNIAKEIGPCPLSLDELDAEMLCGFWEAAARVRTNSRAASTRLYHGARIRAWQAVAQARQRAATMADVDCATLPPPAPSPNPPAILSQALREGVIDQIQCELIAATQIDKEPTAPLARSLGITRAAATMQRTRAMRRLAAWLTATS